MKKHVFILLVFVLASGISRGQRSSIQIMDLMPETINTADSTGKNIDTAHQTMRFYFKVSDITQMDSAIFLIGTKPDKRDIGTINGKCVHLGTSYFIRLSPSQLFLADSYEGYAEVPLEFPYLRSKKYISLIVKDKSGQYTNQLNALYYF